MTAGDTSTVPALYVISNDVEGTDKLCKVLRPLASVEDQATHAWIALKRGSERLLRVGHVYEIPVKNEGRTFVISAAKWIRQYEDTEAVQRWQAAQVALEARIQRRKIEKREATNASGLEDSIAPLRKAYQRLAFSNDRLAFELWLLTQLRKQVRGES